MNDSQQLVPVDDLWPTVRELTEKLAHMPTQAIGLAKQAFNAAWNTDLATQLDLEAELQGEAAQTHDHHEGVRAFVEKRTPEFRGE